MKRYYVFLLCSLFLFPASSFADEGIDSIGLPQTFNYKKSVPQNFHNKSYVGKTNFVGQSLSGKSKKTWFKAMRFGGWARFYPFYRNMKGYYDVAPSKALGLTVPVNITADDGYQQPLMLLRMEANPSAKTYIQTELQFANLLKRTTLLTDTTGKINNLYVIFQLTGGIDTRFGQFKMTAGGGVNWQRISPSTLWSYQYRDDMFERYSWEPEGHDFGRYNSNYTSGDIPRDQRFGRQGIQGFILEGTNLPKGFEATVLYGKTTTSGGFQSYNTKTPQNVFAGRVAKALGNHKIGYNYFNQFGYLNGSSTTAGNQNLVEYKKIAQGTDTFYVENNRMSQLVTTLDGSFVFRHFSVYTELGVGSYLSSQYNAGLRDNARAGVENASFYKRNWDETLFLEITTKRRITFIPLKVSFYRIGANVVNNSSSVSNTSIEQAKPGATVPDNYYTNYYDGMVTDVGQLANNRQGINIIGTKTFFNKLMTKLDIGMSQEIVNLAGDLRNGARGKASMTNPDSASLIPYSNSITFEHRLNGITRSRFNFYERFTGPYGRIHSIFRRTYDNIAITDTVVDYKKSFSTLNFEWKYKFRMFGKEMIVTNYNNYTSVQDRFSPLPVFTDQAFIRYMYNELMAFYAIHQKVTLVGFTGRETAKGNKRTELADANGNEITDANGKPVASTNGKPIDQIGYGYGLGLDYNFHSRASLHFRSRWFTHKDKNFTYDKFRGNEMTVEFKVFF